MLRKGLVLGWLGMLCAVVGALFWYFDWIYKLPTPVPENYHPVATGTYLDFSASIPNPDHKPVFIHFYNPDCPCSRFNKKHFRSLVKSYGDEVQFVAVVMSEKRFTEAEIQHKMDVNIPVLFDSTIANSCGVYATPQAALLDQNSKLYYRGNYNASRYCTDEKTAYAKMAVEGLLKNNKRLAFDDQAMKSYGCTLPICKN